MSNGSNVQSQVHPAFKLTRQQSIESLNITV